MPDRTEEPDRPSPRPRVPGWRRPVVHVLAIILSVSVAGAEEGAPKRPIIGVVLGGGSARGMAHTGVLQWLEEHRIPVDRIAGNSTGALLGAAYATGMPADDIKTVLRNADWDTLLRPDIPYPLRSNRRKEDDRDYAVKIEAGLSHGFRLQSGLNQGHHLGLLISRILLLYSGVWNFDDLPIPFRCVATDLDTGETVIFDRGPISLAVRASMSLPGTYDPVRLDGHLFADGGILNNVPVDVAKDMGADVVIAVRVGPKPEERPPETIPGIANRSISLMMQALEKPRLDQADLVLLPRVDDLSGGDFKKSEEFATRGYEAAEAQKDALLKYALSEADWADYRAAVDARRIVQRDPVSFVEVSGISGEAASQIARQLSRHVGRPPDPNLIDEDLDRMIGLGRYASATYGRRDQAESTGLNVRVQEKSYGPPFIRFALDVNNENRDINLNLGSRITLMDATGLGSEWRIDGSLGSTLGVATELYQPVGGVRPTRGGAFVSPRAAYVRTSENLYVDNELVAIYGRQRAGAGLDLGWNSRGSTRFRAGYEAAYVRNITRVGNPLLPRSTGGEHSLRASLDYDGQDAAHLPSQGRRIAASARWFLEAPDAQGRFGVIETSMATSRLLAHERSITLSASGGATFGASAPTLYQFSLGGPFRLGAFPPSAFRGPRYALAGLGYRVPVGRLPKLLGGRLYANGLIEAGSIFESLSDARLRTSFSAGLSADTLFGPFFAGGSVGRDGGRVYFMIGRLVP